MEEYVEANGLRFHVTTAGSGPPVMLLHGFPDSALLWRHQIDALAANGHRVIAPDLRGLGRTDRPADVKAYRMRTLVRDVEALLDHYQVGSTALVGHDWGAALAWAVAAFVPERVERLAVVSVGHPAANMAASTAQHRLSWYMLWFLFPGVAEERMPCDDWAFFRKWAWAGADADDPDLRRQIADLSRDGALTAALNWYRANIDPARYVEDDPRQTGFPAVTCPTMGVWSSGDFALGEAQMTGSHRYVDAPWRYERIEDVDHWVPVHAPAQLNSLLLDFLA